MAKSYMPDSDGGRVTWLNHLAATLPTYVGQAGITAEDVTSIQKDAARWAYTMVCQEAMQTGSESVTASKNEMRDGLAPGETPSAAPLAPPVFPTPAPTMVAPGIFRRVADFVARLKRTDGYTPAMGEALGIEAPASVEKPKQEFQAGVKSLGLNLGHPVLRIDRDGAPQAEVFCDYGGPSMQHVTTTMRSEFTDMHPLPPAGTAQVWRYQAACHDGSGPFGQMSEILSVTVRGL